MALKSPAPLHPSSRLGPPQYNRRSRWKLTLLPQFWFSLLHTGNNHVAHTGIWQSVQAGSKLVRLDNEKTLGAAVVDAVQDGTNGQT